MTARLRVQDPHSIDLEYPQTHFQRHPPEWRAQYERAIADGSVRSMPSVRQQFAEMREEVLRNVT